MLIVKLDGHGTLVSPRYRGGGDFKIDPKKISFKKRKLFFIHS
jgi:hypothetical protein